MGVIFVIACFAHCKSCDRMVLVCWYYIQENPPLFIIVRVEWRYTSWMWKITRLRNCRRGSGMICCWSCLVKSLNLWSGEGLRAERILRRSGVAWTSGGAQIYLRESEGERHVSPSWLGSDLITTDAPCPFACRSLQKGSRKRGVGRRLFNALSLSWYSWADENLDHQCNTSFPKIHT